MTLELSKLALEDADKVCAFDPKNVEARYRKAICMIGRGLCAHALKFLKNFLNKHYLGDRNDSCLEGIKEVIRTLEDAGVPDSIPMPTSPRFLLGQERMNTLEGRTPYSCYWCCRPIHPPFLDDYYCWCCNCPWGCIQGGKIKAKYLGPSPKYDASLLRFESVDSDCEDEN